MQGSLIQNGDYSHRSNLIRGNIYVIPSRSHRATQTCRQSQRQAPETPRNKTKIWTEEEKVKYVVQRLFWLPYDRSPVFSYRQVEPHVVLFR